MPFFSGKITAYNSSNNYQITPSSIPSYTPMQTDTIILSACPSDASSDSDNVNIWAVWNNTVWNIYVSDSGYTGDITYHVKTQ